MAGGCRYLFEIVYLILLSLRDDLFETGRGGRPADNGGDDPAGGDQLRQGENRALPGRGKVVFSLFAFHIEMAGAASG
jgi:hypothetical protein